MTHPVTLSGVVEHIFQSSFKAQQVHKHGCFLTKVLVTFLFVVLYVISRQPLQLLRLYID